MEELIISIFGKFSILIVPIVCGVITSFVVEAISKTLPRKENVKMVCEKKVRGKIVNAVASFLLGVLMIFVFPSLINGVPEIIFFIILNWSFATMFYHFGGRKTVEAVVNGATKLIKKKTEQ